MSAQGTFSLLGVWSGQADFGVVRDTEALCNFMASNFRDVGIAKSNLHDYSENLLHFIFEASETQGDVTCQVSQS